MGDGIQYFSFLCIIEYHLSQFFTVQFSIWQENITPKMLPNFLPSICSWLNNCKKGYTCTYKNPFNSIALYKGTAIRDIYCRYTVIGNTIMVFIISCLIWFKCFPKLKWIFLSISPQMLFKHKQLILATKLLELRLQLCRKSNIFKSDFFK